jgi:hypothetical protein
MKTKKNYILITICGILIASSVFLTVETATSGAEVARLDKTTVEMSNQKRILEENLIKGISMTQLQEKSLELGFVKPSNLIYISSISPVAKLP